MTKSKHVKSPSGNIYVVVGDKDGELLGEMIHASPGFEKYLGKLKPIMSSYVEIDMGFDDEPAPVKKTPQRASRSSSDGSGGGVYIIPAGTPWDRKEAVERWYPPEHNVLDFLNDVIFDPIARKHGFPTSRDMESEDINTQAWIMNEFGDEY